IHHPQRMTPLSVAQGKMPFEIHLPQLIGGFPLEALPGLVFARLAQVHPPMPSQNRVDRAAGGDLGRAPTPRAGPPAHPAAESRGSCCRREPRCRSTPPAGSESCELPTPDSHPEPPALWLPPPPTNPPARAGDAPTDTAIQ